jgi:hypothetical protein
MTELDNIKTLFDELTGYFDTIITTNQELQPQPEQDQTPNE